MIPAVIMRDRATLESRRRDPSTEVKKALGENLNGLPFQAAF